MNQDPIENKIRHIETLVGTAATMANSFHAKEVKPEHLLYVIAGTEEGRRVMEGMGGNPRRIREFLSRSFEATRGPYRTQNLKLSDLLVRVTSEPIRAATSHGQVPGLRDIIREMAELGKDAVILRHALVIGGIMEPWEDGEDVARGLRAAAEDWSAAEILGVSESGKEAGQESGQESGQTVSDPKITEEDFPDLFSHDDVPPDPAESDIPGEDDDTPGKAESEHEAAVERATRDLSEIARAGGLDGIVGRDREIGFMLETISKRKKKNLIIMGDPGVGKTAMAEGLADYLSGTDVPESLKGRPVLEVAISDLVAGARFRGDFEARMQALMAMARRRRAILFLDEFHLVVGAGSSSSQGGMDAANILKPALARGDITVIGATTPGEMRDIRRDGALMRRFDILNLREPTSHETREILGDAVDRYVDHHEVLVSGEVLDVIVDLAGRYLTAAHFPDKAFNVLDTSCVIAARRGAGDVTTQDVRLAVERNGGPRLLTPGEDDMRRLSGLETALSKRVLGQDEAITALARATRAASLGMNQGGTAGAYLFNGPTGVGKTEMARAFADAMDLPLVRIDMSELMERHSVSTLIGSPPGYVGHENDGILISAADRFRNMVLLFDEAEKAHPDVHDILLQILDAGTVRAGDGRMVSLAGAHVILSANIGAAASERQSIGFGRETDPAEVAQDAIRGAFRKEMIGRIRNRIQFATPDRSVVREIVKKELEAARRTYGDRGIRVTFDDALVDIVAGADIREYGMREIQDRILDRIHVPLTDAILNTSATRLHVTGEDGRVRVETREIRQDFPA